MRSMTISALMGLAMASEASRRDKRRHMTGRGRRTLYTYHVKLNGGSCPVPGGGLRECQRRVEQSMRAEARRGAA
jgi:hypothetical protein